MCMKRTAHGRSMFPNVARCKPSVSQTYPCLHTHTSSRGYQRPYRGQILCCVSCVIVLCPALSCSASLPGGPVSSSHTVTLTQQRKSDDPEHQLPLCLLSLCLHSKSNSSLKTSPSSTSFFRCEAPHGAGSWHAHKLAQSFLAGCRRLSTRGGNKNRFT